MKVLPKILLALTAVAALSVAYPAKADTITTFNVSGTCVPQEPPFTGTTFSGTLTIDVTTGTVTAIDVSFQGFSPFNVTLSSDPSSSDLWQIIAITNVGNDSALELIFTTGHTPGSLVGFMGGTIFGDSATTGTVPEYSDLRGSITAPAGVPDGGSTVSLLGCALLGLAALRRKLGC
jgi:hypothetical protein